MTENARQLAERYLPMATNLARRAAALGGDPGDMEDAAQFALVEAARTFDPSRCVSFARFARHRIRGALTDARYGRAGRQIRIDRGHALRLADVPAPSEPDSVEARDAFDHLVRRLPVLHKAVCRLIYAEGLDRIDVAARMGVSRSYITRVHDAAIDRLRKPAPYGIVGIEDGELHHERCVEHWRGSEDLPCQSADDYPLCR